ncbi:hypothetical protein BGZ98_001051 [Dissophora globulifera]|nr:hypothetical protein BGZ98_001051 [Dissophora globulifera]
MATAFGPSSTPSAASSSLSSSSQREPSVRLDRDRGKAPLQADTVAGLSALLRSSTVLKLQDYGLRILTHHRFLVQIDSFWGPVLMCLKPILEALKAHLMKVSSDPLHDLLDENGDFVEQLNLRAYGSNSGGDNTQEKEQELEDSQGQDAETAIRVQSKALTLLQWFLQEAGTRPLTSTQSLSLIQADKDRISHFNDNNNSIAKLNNLREVADMALLVDLWKAVQLIVLFDKTKLPMAERLVLAISACVYWTCWVFQEEAMSFVMGVGSDTLLAWYGYYIIPRGRSQHHNLLASGLAESPVTLSATPGPGHSNHSEEQREKEQEEVVKQQSSILEYLSKLIQNLVTPKKRQAALFVGDPPVGIVIMRRTIEFLENILDSTPLPLVSSHIVDMDVEQDSGLTNIYDGNNNRDEDITFVSYPVKIIQDRLGILEAMSGIIAGCIGGSREGDSLVMNSRLLHVFLLLLSDLRPLLGLYLSKNHKQSLESSTARKTRQLALSNLQLILNRDAHVPGLDDVPITHWTVGYTALVDMIMKPLERARWKRVQTMPDDEEDWTVEEEAGLKAMRVFALFWKHHAKGRYMLSDLLGPRLYRLRMIPLLLSLTECSTVTRTGPEATTRASKSRRERTVLLVESMVYFGNESSVRINMRERWHSLPFLVALLGASLKRLELNRYSPSDNLSKVVAQRCLLALKNFWFDKIGLLQLIDLHYPSVTSGQGGNSNDGEDEEDGEPSWDSLMPKDVVQERHKASPLGGSSTSIVPVLVAMLVPPGTEWSSELMLGSRTPDGRQCRRPRRRRHPLFEQQDSLLADAGQMLAQLSKFTECQQRLISKPGVIWMLTRIMVERSLVGHLDVALEDNSGDGASVTTSGGLEESGPRDLLEKALFEALTRILSSADLAKSLVSNNTITEFFAAVEEVDRPLTFYRMKMAFDDELSSRTTMVSDTDTDTALDDTSHSRQHSDSAIDSDIAHATTTTTTRCDILPTPRQHDLQQQLLQHLRMVMAPLRGQFERIYQYIGGYRSLQGADESAETMYWLREYCALVFLYTIEPPGPTSRPTTTMAIASSTVAWGARIDKTALLNSDSAFGVVCRMLTLEMEYDPMEVEEGGVPELSLSGATAETGTEQEAGAEESISKDNEAIDVQKEEALLRRFSAGVAIQSLTWKHVDTWRQQHAELMHEYEGILTTEWEAHVAALRGDNDINIDTHGVTAMQQDKMPVSFLVGERVVTFPDRLVLSRTSTFFHTLLRGDFREGTEQQQGQHILVGDVDADDFEMLLEVVRESQLTAKLLLPDDLPFALVLRLMVCAERFMVVFVRRLAEAWILKALRVKELKWFDEKPKMMRFRTAKMGQVEAGKPLKTDETRIQQDGAIKHLLEQSLDRPQEKRQKLEQEQPPTAAEASFNDAPEAATVAIALEQRHDEVAKEYPDDNDSDDADDDDKQESMQECLMMVYEVCSDPHHGSLYSPGHPFRKLGWDVLQMMILRLGSVAITPRFAAMLDAGGEECIQDFLEHLYDLIVNPLASITHLTDTSLA